MIRVDNPRDEANVAQVYEANQEQVFQYWNDLDAVERRSLLDQIASIDFPEFRRLVESKRADSPAGETPGTRLAPAAMIPLPRTAEEREARDRAHAAGMEALNAGEVGVFLVSRTRVSPARATQRAVVVAIPLRWPRMFSAVRSAARRETADPRTSRTSSPLATDRPSVAAVTTSTEGSSRWKTRAATSAPQSTPASTAVTEATARSGRSPRSAREVTSSCARSSRRAASIHRRLASTTFGSDQK